jgi:hypothetical protein
LIAKLGVPGPLSVHFKHFTGSRRQKIADNGYRITLAAHLTFAMVNPVSSLV